METTGLYITYNPDQRVISSSGKELGHTIAIYKTFRVSIMELFWIQLHLQTTQQNTLTHCKNSGVVVTPNWGVSKLCTSDTPWGVMILKHDTPKGVIVTPIIENIKWGVSQGTWVVP